MNKILGKKILLVFCLSFSFQSFTKIPVPVIPEKLVQTALDVSGKVSEKSATLVPMLFNSTEILNYGSKALTAIYSSVCSIYAYLILCGSKFSWGRSDSTLVNEFIASQSISNIQNGVTVVGSKVQDGMQTALAILSKVKDNYKMILLITIAVYLSYKIGTDIFTAIKTAYNWFYSFIFGSTLQNSNSVIGDGMVVKIKGPKPDEIEINYNNSGTGIISQAVNVARKFL